MSGASVIRYYVAVKAFTTWQIKVQLWAPKGVWCKKHGLLR